MSAPAPVLDPAAAAEASFFLAGWREGVRLRRGEVQEYSLSGPDPALAFQPPHTPAGPMDASGVGFVINTLPRFSGGLLVRYRALLAVATIGSREQARVIGVRQYLSLGGNTDRYPEFVEQQIVGPTWRFTDTYVRWGIAHAEGRTANQVLDALGSNTGANPSGIDRSLDGYRGFTWGSFTDLRFPWVWGSPAPAINAPLLGPGAVMLWAEFTQTDPATRGQRSPGVGGVFINPDDRFTADYPDTSVYYRIAGALTLERGLATDPGGQ